MGTTSKVCSLFLRFFELACSAIVTGLVSRFFALVHSGRGSHNSRLIYTLVIAVLGIVLSLVLMPPLRYSFMMWPVDIAMFIMWIVAFGLDVDLTGTHTCTSDWYWNYWGYYWNRWYNIDNFDRGFIGNSPGCAKYRTVLAFLFLGAFAWLLSAILGLIVFTKRRDTAPGTRASAAAGAGAAGHSRRRLWRKRNAVDVNGSGTTAAHGTRTTPETAQVV